MRPLLDILLGPPGHPRERTAPTLLALAVYVGFAGIQRFEVMLGLMDAAEAWRLSLVGLTGAFAFYGLVRSRLSERLSKDPALTVSQMLFGMFTLTWCYAISGPVRGAVASLMMLVVLFGLFSLPERAARRVALCGFLMLGGVMAAKGLADPGGHEPRIELVHLMISVVVLVAVSRLANRLSRLRERLRAQKTELQVALERIRDLATRDPLTDLLNRRAMAEVLLTHAGDRRVATDGLSVALIDLDHFKRVNDTHGHAVGDQVLRAFAAAASSTLRTGDVLARWGGEEFLLLLPGTPEVAAVVCVERIRARLAKEPFGQVLPPFQIGFSCGVSSCAGVHDIEAAVERADQAMYRAKTAGRNRSVIGNAAPQPQPQDLPQPQPQPQPVAA